MYRSVALPGGAVAEIGTTSPALYQPLPGLTVPPGTFELIVRKYWVVKIAVTVFALSAVTVSEGDGLPVLHAENVYRVPVPANCGVVATALWGLDRKST